MSVEYSMEAILLAASNWSSADRMVTLFSREYGIVIAMAYGARKPKSKLGGTLQPFTHMQCLMAHGKGMDVVRQCEIQTSYREIREDLIRLAYANFIAELLAGLWPERQSEPAAFDMLLAILALLASRNPRIATLSGAWKLLALAGFQPEYEWCTRCGCKLSLPAYFSFIDGGGICTKCNSSDAPVFEQPTKDLLDKILSLDLSNPGQFTVNSRSLANAENLLFNYVRHQLERPLKSLDFINKVNAL